MAMAIKRRAQEGDAMTIEAHADAVRQAENDRQQAVAATAAEARAADIQYHRARLASALATGVSPSVSLQPLRALGAEMREPVAPSAIPLLGPVNDRPV
jgi:hypothetical protein